MFCRVRLVINKKENAVLNRYLSILVAITVFQMLVTPIFATQQNDVEVRQDAKIRADVTKRGVGENVKVRVKLRNKTQVNGYISEAGDDSFTVTEPRSNLKST